MKKKTIALIVCLTLIIGGAIGGTIAWLTDTTEAVTNTFTAGDVDIDLAESENLNLKMVPGNTIAKDPIVTVKANSEACWLFVKVEKSANFDTFMTYTMADGWTALDGVTGVYYREVAATSVNTDFPVIKDNRVSVKGEVTKAQLDTLTESTQPTLTFTAYACQKDGFETNPAGAWAEVSK